MTIGWTTTSYVPRMERHCTGPRGAVVLLVGGTLLALAWVSRNVLLLAFFALVLATLLSVPVGFLTRWMSRPVALLLVVIAVAGGGVGVGAVVAPTLSDQLVQARREVPKAIARVNAFVQRLEESTGAISGGDRSVLPDVTSQALPAAAWVGTGLASAVLVGVTALFLAIAPAAYRDALRRLVPPGSEETFDEGWARVAHGLRSWVGGILVSMTLMGTMTALGLWAIGVPNAALLGLITFFATFVPYLGALVSAIPGLLLALSLDTTHFLLALGVYAAVHVTEGYLVEPLVMRRAVRVRPALLLFAQATATAVFGVPGTMVATPLLVCLQELTTFLWIERRLGKGPAVIQSAHDPT